MLTEKQEDVTLKDLHGQHSPGVLQIGDVQVASRVAGQADVQHSVGAETEEEKEEVEGKGEGDRLLIY